MKNNLPLAEKTNINGWAFDDLLLTGMTTTNHDVSEYTLTENSVLIIDGQVIKSQLDENVKFEAVGFKNDVPVDNKLMGLINEHQNSVFKLTVAKNVRVSKPLSVIIVANDRSLVHSSIIELEQGASLDYTETLIGKTANNALIASRFNVGSNANLTVNTINELHPNTVVYHQKRTDVETSGVVDNTNFVINDTNLVFEDLTYLNGKGSEAETKTVSITSNNQKQNMTIRVENIADHSIGNIINYGITKDEAHLAFNGVGKIQKDAKGCDNQQETRMLNLSKTAEAVANPFLLIDEGDITAGHAASIGQLDEEQIYYLMSRGMTREAASKLIVSGFLTPFVDALEDEVAREKLTAKIEEKLG